jgi:hypothetical protein
MRRGRVTRATLGAELRCAAPLHAAVVNGRCVKSTFSIVSGGHLSFTVADGLIGFQYDKPAGGALGLHPRLRPARDGRLHRRGQERRVRPPVRLTTPQPGTEHPVPVGVGAVRGKDTTVGITTCGRCPASLLTAPPADPDW